MIWLSLKSNGALNHENWRLIYSRQILSLNSGIRTSRSGDWWQKKRSRHFIIFFTSCRLLIRHDLSLSKWQPLHSWYARITNLHLHCLQLTFFQLIYWQDSVVHQWITGWCNGLIAMLPRSFGLHALPPTNNHPGYDTINVPQIHARKTLPTQEVINGYEHLHFNNPVHQPLYAKI